MSPLKVDLYSDTQSHPTTAMRQFMVGAEVGDEQRGEDPTTNRLAEMVAALLGKEAAVFLPSGTMCNEIAYRVHCEPGDEIILDKTPHALHFEVGGPGALSGVMTHALDGQRGMFEAERLAQDLAQIPGIRIDPERIDTNIVIFDVEEATLTGPEISARLLEQGVRIGAFDDTTMRAVTYLDIDADDIALATAAMRSTLGV